MFYSGSSLILDFTAFLPFWCFGVHLRSPWRWEADSREILDSSEKSDLEKLKVWMTFSSQSETGMGSVWPRVSFCFFFFSIIVSFHWCWCWYGLILTNTRGEFINTNLDATSAMYLSKGRGAVYFENQDNRKSLAAKRKCVRRPTSGFG